MAFWMPKRQLGAGDSMTFYYRLYWRNDEPHPPPNLAGQSLAGGVDWDQAPLSGAITSTTARAIAASCFMGSAYDLGGTEVSIDPDESTQM